MHFFLGFCPCMPLLSFSNSLTTTYLHTIILTQNSMSREHLYLLNKYVLFNPLYYSLTAIFSPPFSPLPFSPWIWLKFLRHFLPKFQNLVLIPSIHNLIHFIISNNKFAANENWRKPEVPLRHPLQVTSIKFQICWTDLTKLGLGTSEHRLG